MTPSAALTTSTPNIGGGPGYHPFGSAVDSPSPAASAPMEIDNDIANDISTVAGSAASAPAALAPISLTPEESAMLDRLVIVDPVVPNHGLASGIVPSVVPVPTSQPPQATVASTTSLVNAPSAIPAVSYRKVPEFKGGVFTNARDQSWVTHVAEVMRQLETVGPLAEPQRIAFFINSLGEDFKSIARWVPRNQRGHAQTLETNIKRVQAAVTSVTDGESADRSPFGLLRIKHEDNMSLLSWLTAVRNYHQDLLSAPGTNERTTQLADETLAAVLTSNVRQPYLARINKVDRDWRNKTTAMPCADRLDSLLMALTEMAVNGPIEKTSRPAATKPQGPPAKKAKTDIPCRYNGFCTRANCRFKHEEGFQPRHPDEMKYYAKPASFPRRKPSKTPTLPYEPYCPVCRVKGHTYTQCKAKDAKKNE